MLFFFLTALHSMWNFSSPTQDGTHSPCVGRAVLTNGPRGSPSALLFFHLTIYPRVPWPPQRWSSFLCTAAQNCTVWMYGALFSQSSADGLVGSTNIYCMTKLCQALEIKPWSLASGNSVCREGELLQYKYFPHKELTWIHLAQGECGTEQTGSSR